MLRQAQHERIWRTHPLMPHPQANGATVKAVSVHVRSSSRHGIGLRYRVEPARNLRLPDQAGGRTDELWRSTCFELFVMPIDGMAYHEFNFAPHDAWAAYSFSDRRTDMTAAPVDRPPHMVDGREENRAAEYPDVYELDVYVDRGSWPRGVAQIGLSAVIEETDGTKSYWALAHPDGPPDFHDPACFVLELPAK